MRKSKNEFVCSPLRYTSCILVFLCAVFFFININYLFSLHYTSCGIVNTSETGSSNTQLAYQQSQGFFDDITDENWKRAQKLHSKLFPNHSGENTLSYSNGPKDKGNRGKLNKSNFWNAQNFQEEFHCFHSQRIPTDSNGDGPKWVCDPHRIAKQKSCLVYSVGSNGKVEFEAGVKNEIGEHCEIHTFDMESSNRRNGNFADALAGYATFHHWGFGTQKESDRSSSMKTLSETMVELGHEGRTIDIFKIDCEWCEWFTHKQWLNEDIRQILVETHNAPMPNARDFFYNLHDAGYVIFSKEANFQNAGGCVEFAFLKLSPDFFNGDLYSSKYSIA